MKIKVRGFILPHNGDYMLDCEDRFAISDDGKAFAIADGVTQSVYPHVLADALVTGFIEKREACFNTDKTDLSKEFKENIEIIYKQYEEEEKAKLTESQRKIYNFRIKRNGPDRAAATFVGFQFIEKNGKYDVEYYSLGDSYLFFVPQDDGKIKSYCSMVGTEHGNQPEYFSTDGNGKGTLKSERFELKEGIFFLMTDALSDWFLKYLSIGDIDRLKKISTHLEFAKFVDEKRKDGSLGNDDTTMVMVEVSEIEKKDIELERGNIDVISSIIEEEKIDEKQKEIDEFEKLIEEHNQIIEKHKQTIEKLEQEIKKIKERLTILENKKGLISRIIERIKSKEKNTQGSIHKDDKTLKEENVESLIQEENNNEITKEENHDNKEISK